MKKRKKDLAIKRKISKKAKLIFQGWGSLSYSPEFQGLSLGTAKVFNCLCEIFHDRSQGLGVDPFGIKIKVNQEILAQKSKVCRKTVITSLQTLEDRRFIKIKRNGRDSRTGLTRLNEYKLIHPYFWRVG